MESIAGALKELVGFLTEERRNKDDAIKEILLSNHPTFRRLKSLTKTAYRVYFTSASEMNAWLTARGYKEVSAEVFDEGSVAEWQKAGRYIKFTKNIFDRDGKLRPFSEDDWDDEWIIEGVIDGDDDGPPF